MAGGEETILSWNTRITKIYKGGEKLDNTVNSENHGGFDLNRPWRGRTWEVRSKRLENRKAPGKEGTHIKQGS